MSDKMKILKGGALPATKFVRLIVFGPTGGGKSTFGATMPGPRVVLATDANAALPLERSYAEVPRIYMPPGEKDRRPDIFMQVESWAQVQEALVWLEDNQEAYDSVIIDSASILNELCKREVLAERQASLSRSWSAAGKTNSQIESLDLKGWGTLGDRMDTTRFRMHKLAAHVLWICGYLPPKSARDDSSKAVKGGPDLSPGKQAIRFPYACQASLYIERDVFPDGTSQVRLYSTMPDVDAKDNSGRLDGVEPPDAMVLLARLGYLEPELAQQIIDLAPKRSAEEIVAGNLGLDL
jgi:hypothetical protein